MKQRTRLILGSLCVLLLLTSCKNFSSSSDMHTQTVPDASYKAALERTDPVNYQLPARGSKEEATLL
ncbi:MAG: major membrane immunogen (membrane-anchored lipoprotein), partial [Lentimonas sp.]